MNEDRIRPSFERAPWEELHAQLVMVNANPALQGIVHNASECILLLNQYRQIIFANTASQKMLCSGGDVATLYGCRPGEAMSCIHARYGEGGCGTAPFCRMCGARNAVIKSLDGFIDVQCCSINLEGLDSPLEAIVFSIPINIKDQSFVLVAIRDRGLEHSENEIAKQIFVMQGLAAKIERG